MAEGMHKQFQDSLKAQLKTMKLNSEEKSKIKAPDFAKSLPKEILKSKNGCCLYFNPEEGMEIWTDFSKLISGLQKNGKDLSQDELYVVSDFIFSDSISPNFVKKLLQKYGDGSIRGAFFLKESIGEYFVDYLLRQYKGQYFRNRYPSISFVQ